MASSSTSSVYVHVIEDVINKVRDEFINNGGPGEGVLAELQGEIGEEFVEFLEKELNITDSEAAEDNNNEKFTKGFSLNETKEAASADQKGSNKASSIDESIDEIEATLAQLKKELGLE